MVVNVYENTKFEEIYHMFLNSIQDYHIKNIFVNDVEVGEDLLETFLLRGVTKFKNCKKNLKDVDMVNKSFCDYLDLEEKNIVTNLMMLSWMDYVINNITQMEINLNDNDCYAVLIYRKIYFATS